MRSIPACLGVTKRDHAAGEERFRGFLDVLEEKGIDWDNSFYEESAFSVEDGYEAMGRLWERHPEIDAVFGATDSVALGALGWLQEHQIRIPQQVAISGVATRFPADRCAEAFQRALFLPDQRTGGGAAFAGADEWKSCRKRN